MPRRARHARAQARLTGRELATEAALNLGKVIRTARRRRSWTLAELAAKVALTPARLSQMELGHGAGAGLETWYAVAEALKMPFKAEFARDATADALDAGHLQMQELMLRLATQTQRLGTFELRTRPDNPTLSIDVCVRDDVQRILFIEECWNSFGNINASVRSTQRKVAEARDLAVALGGERGPYEVAACWIVRDTRRNRELLARYPEVFASAFRGSSRDWVKALSRPNVRPPTEMGLVWCDLRATRVFAWRR
jgi:transcriptional regulator with XRE-family HTH domain